jgi:PAS domain S-box-containing protein
MTAGLEGSAIAAAGAALAAVAAAGAALVLRARRRRGGACAAAEAALRASEDRLRWALDATSDIVWDWDLVRDTIYHPSWAQTYGFPEERTPRTGQELLPFIHPEDVPRFHAAMSAVVAGPRERFEVEHRALAASGEWRWVLGRGRVVARDAAGNATRLVGTCTDVTEQKRMLGRLQIADRMASIGTLAAGVAHEINNPLAYVLGNLEVSVERLEELAAPPRPAQDAELPGALRECVEALREAQDGARRVRDIVRDMKVFSRVEDQPGTAAVEIARALRAALSLADHEIRHRARIVLDVADVPPVVASEARLSQVFLNLLVNAAQAIPEGHADSNEIRVTVRRRGTDEVTIEFHDTGAGIATEHRERLFDPFFTTKAPGAGTGLGLAICHGIVTALGGGIEVESEAGEGATFRVTLPIAREAVAPRPDGPSRTARRAPDAPRARIFVVDDEPLFCRMVERVLAAQHDVVSLNDAREALRRVEAGERYDCAVLDLAMPVLTGMELHAEIARLDPRLAERTLFVTGGAFTAATAEFVSQNPGRVIEKPLAPDTLRTAVARVLGRAERVRGAPAA